MKTVFASYRIIRILALLTFLLLALIPGIVTSLTIVPPVKRLVSGTAKVANGDLRHSFKLGGSFEFYKIGQALNMMVARINSAMDELRKTEKALRVSEKNYRELVQSANSIIFITDTDGKILFMNDFGLNFFGHSEDEIIGSNIIGSLISGATVEEKNLHTLSQDIFSSPEKYKSQVLENISKNGGQVWIAWTSKIMLNPTGDVRGILCIGNDISERKRLDEEKKKLEARLRHQKKLESIGTLAGGVAHEINNPINGIMNYAQIIIDRLGKGHQLEEPAAEIIHETKRVATIVRNLLTFAREEKQTHTQARMQDIINATLSLVKTVIRNDQIKLQLNIPDKLPSIKCRSQQIQQVLMNLVTNARDALNERYQGYHEDKIIRISVKQYDNDGLGWIRTTVEDHGAGIDSHIEQQIFDPFFTSKPREKGTGLGLSISYGIAHEHGGELQIESSQGHFTRFHLDLPINGDTKPGKI